MSFPLHTIDMADSIYRPVEGSFRLVSDQELSTGTWDASFRIAGPRSLRWVCDLAMAPLHDDGAEDRRMTWDITVARMMGGYVATRLYHPARILPRGMGAGVRRVGFDRFDMGQYVIDGSYLIDGAFRISGGSTFATVDAPAARYADSVRMAGLVPSSMALRKGDHFELGGNLYMVADDCLSDSSGRSMVPFLWRLWKPALTGDRIALYRPTGRFVLTAKDGGEQRYTTNLVGQASLQAIEIPHVS